MQRHYWHCWVIVDLCKSYMYVIKILSQYNQLGLAPMQYPLNTLVIMMTRDTSVLDKQLQS